MHPSHHSASSAKKFGGKPEDYDAIHNWFDASKAAYGDARHRALRHHTQGIFEAEKVFGVSFVNSSGKKVLTRYVGEQHVKEDCGGRLPTMAEWFSRIVPAKWMYAVGKYRDHEFKEELK